MAKKRKRRSGEYEGATCRRCELPLDPKAGVCPNKFCPYHFSGQDEIVTDDGPPSEEELRYIEELRAALDDEA